MVNQLFNITTIPAALATSPVSAAAADAAPTQPVPAVLAPAAATQPAPATSVGVISTQQSAITFAGAPAAVMLVWKVLGAAEPSWANSKLLAIVLSLIVGMLIYWQSAPVYGTKKEKITGFAFALINSFAIAAAALGINSTT